MIEVSSKQARGTLSSIIRRVEQVARIVPMSNKSRGLPSLKGFRSSIRVTGESLSSVVVKDREKERY
jgi:antitoxin (DNA-binding transcriptional repressor) of toxin-antitoxin stability system